MSPKQPPENDAVSFGRTHYTHGEIRTYPQAMYSVAYGKQIAADGVDVKTIDRRKYCRCEISYSTLEMEVRETQTLSASGPAWNSDCAWKITQGGGALSTVAESSTIYTAPEDDTDGTSIVIEIQNAAGETIDSITITLILCDCTISYTTLVMSNTGSASTQELTKSGTWRNDCYWDVTSGSVDDETADTITFTAPASNVNCASNPTVYIKDVNGDVVDSITIQVLDVYSGSPTINLSDCTAAVSCAGTNFYVAYSCSTGYSTWCEKFVGSGCSVGAVTAQCGGVSAGGTCTVDGSYCCYYVYDIASPNVCFFRTKIGTACTGGGAISNGCGC